jgi:Raf kinase inhibitor-like YbhB/YbcL family protein
LPHAPAFSPLPFTNLSPAIDPNGLIPERYVGNRFGSTGGDISPPLTWSGVPAAAKSLALTVYDPDAPTGSGFWHWLVANLPPSIGGLPEGAGAIGGAGLPAGAVFGLGDAGVAGYFGPTPPAGDPPHRYVFTLHAVDTDRLPVDSTTSGALVGFALHYHTLAKATVIYRYGQK